MKILLKNVTILDSQSPFHSKSQDILIQEGIITEIASSLKVEKGVETITYNNQYASRGWFDPSVSFGEPGYEERETLSNGAIVAAKSGFTKILLNSNTDPVPDSASVVGNLVKMTAGFPASIHPIGALTVGCKGEQMASLYDMHNNGAIAFGDHKISIDKANLLKIALQYCQSFEGRVISFPQNKELAAGGLMHEGVSSTRIGMKGIPSMAETVQISRDIDILKYTGGKLHIPYLSTAAGLELIRAAKRSGLELSCSVGLPHLVFEDQELESFDANFKIFPPIRSKSDQQALRAGLLDGSIDMVSSMHEPMNIENKKLEFENAAPGSLGFESCFGMLNKIFPVDHVINFLTRGAKHFNISSPAINIGEKADLTLFDPDVSYRLTEDDLKSTSKNSAYLGRDLQGKVLGTIYNGKLSLNE